MSTATESGSGTVPGEISARVSRRLYLPTVVMAAITAWLSWRGWTALEDFGPARSISAGRFQLIGPVVIGFALVVFSIEQLWPAERRPLLARGHLLDLGYLVFYAVLVVPLVVLIGAGFADLLADAAPWLVLPRVPAVPGWCFVALAVLGITALLMPGPGPVGRLSPPIPAPARPPGDTGQMSEGLVVPALAAGPFRLRPFVLADLDVVREAARDPYIPLITTVPAEFTDTEGRRYIERQWDRARRGSGYSFAIADAATGRAVGSIGLWLHDIGAGRASVGYWVAGPARGRGASRHALRTLIFWALGVLGIPRLELYVEPWNEASIRVAEQAGFRQEGLLRSWQEVGGERKDMLMYSLLRSDLPEA